MTVTLEEAKRYLRVDYTDDDAQILQMLVASEGLVADTLRKDLSAEGSITPTVIIAVLFSVAYMYEHRENADMSELTKNLRYILMAEREAAF